MLSQTLVAPDLARMATHHTLSLVTSHVQPDYYKREKVGVI